MSVFTSPNFRRITWRITLIAVIFFVLVAAGSILFVSIKKEWIIEKLTSYANDIQSGEIKTGQSDILWFKNFPHVTVDIKNLEYYEHPVGRQENNEKPILRSGHIFVTLNIWKLLRKSELEISSAGIQNAILNFVSDTNGVLNIDKALRNPNPKGGQPLTIDLQLITFDSLLFNWEFAKTQRSSQFLIRKLSAYLTYSGDSIHTRILSTQELNAFYLKNTVVNNAGVIGADLNLTYNISKKLLTVHSGILSFEELKVKISGYYDHINDQAIYFNFDGSSNEFALLKTLIKEDLVKLNKNILQHGKIDMKGKLYGKLKVESPQLEFSMVAKEIDLILPDKMGEFKNLGFDCSFHSGKPDDFSEAVLEVKNLKGSIPGGSITGNLRIENFINPIINYHLDATARLDGYDRIFNFNSINHIKGNVSIQSGFKGSLDLTNPNPPSNPANGIISFDHVAFTFAKTNKRVTAGSGKIVLANYGLSARDVHFQYEKSNMKLDGSLSKPYHILFKHKSIVNAILDIRSDNFFISDFVSDNKHKTNLQDKATNLHLEIAFTSTVNSIRSRRGTPDFTFKVKNFSSEFDNLPDIIKLTASGGFTGNTFGVRMKLDDFHCNMSTGSFALMGEMNVNRKNAIEVESHISMNQFPVEYINDFIRVFQNIPKPDSGKYFSDKLKQLTADMKFSAALVTNPFGIINLDIENGKADLLFKDASQWKADDVALHVKDMFFTNSVSNDAITKLKFNTCNLSIDQLTFPGLGKSSVIFLASGADEPGDSIFDLRKLTLQVKLPQGSFTLKGKVSLDTMNIINIETHISADKLSLSKINTLINLLQMPLESTSQKDDKDKVKINSADLNLTASVTINPFVIRKLNVQKSQADINVTDSARFQTGPFSLSIEDLSFDKSTGTTGMGLNLVKGELRFEAFEVPVFGKSAIQLEAKGRNDRLNIIFSGNLFHAKRDVGQLSMDLSGNFVEYHLQYLVDDAPTDYISKLFRQSERLNGPIDLLLDLNGSITGQSTLNNLQGVFNIQGDNLTLNGLDIDKLLNAYEKSQNFDLVDLGAFVVAGPAGPLLTKSGDFVKLLSANVKPTDKTNIVQFIAKCKLNKGLIIAEDVAFTTIVNRIALKGQIDYVNDTIPGVEIAVVDKNGCSLLDQQFFGKSGKIEHGKLKVASTLSGSITNLASSVAPSDCKPFYMGSVKHPAKKK